MRIRCTRTTGPAWVAVLALAGAVSTAAGCQQRLGAGAFVNAAYEDFSADVFAKKGDFVLRVSMPKGPGAARRQISRQPVAYSICSNYNS